MAEEELTRGRVKDHPANLVFLVVLKFLLFWRGIFFVSTIRITSFLSAITTAATSTSKVTSAPAPPSGGVPPSLILVVRLAVFTVTIR